MKFDVFIRRNAPYVFVFHQHIIAITGNKSKDFAQHMRQATIRTIDGLDYWCV